MNIIGKGIYERGSLEPRPIDKHDIAAWLNIERLELENESGNRLNWTVTLSEDGQAYLVDVADPTGPNGSRSFVVELVVREV